MRQPVPKHAIIGDNSWSLGDGSAPILAWNPQIEDGEDYGDFRDFGR